MEKKNGQHSNYTDHWPTSQLLFGCFVWHRCAFQFLVYFDVFADFFFGFFIGFAHTLGFTSGRGNRD
jgi:hypothetical protein